jgi:hypothetical protein
MFIESPTSPKFGACVKDGNPCELLMGYYSAEVMKKYGYVYLNVSCQLGWEFGRGMCRGYEPAKVTCPTCKGTGADPMSDNVNWLPCGTCHGERRVPFREV